MSTAAAPLLTGAELSRSSCDIVKRIGLIVALIALFAIVWIMIAYGTDTFDARDFIRTGLVITLAVSVLLVTFALTYWPWMGYMTKGA